VRISSALSNIGISFFLDDLASIVNFGALSGFLFLHVSVLARFGFRRRSRAWAVHWAVPLLGIVAVLGVFSGMTALAVRVGLAGRRIALRRRAEGKAAAEIAGAIVAICR
jgi:hypothetical protein